MAEQKTVVCDWDACARKGGQVQRWRIEMTTGVFTADLCKEHSAPLRDFISHFPPHFVVKVRPGGRRPSGIVVRTMDEIEDMKRR